MSNLIYHQERKHPLHRKPEAKQEGGQAHTTQQLSMRVFAQAQPRSNKPRILSRWPWLDMRPIAIVRDTGLKDQLNFLEPNYQLPSTMLVSTLFRKDFDNEKAALLARLCVASLIALTTDIWTLKATQAFATTTGHFFNDEWNLVLCVLETIHFPGSHTGVQISEQIKGLLTSSMVALLWWSH